MCDPYLYSLAIPSFLNNGVHYQQIFRFATSKNESLFLQRKNPRKIAWTQVYRRMHKKGLAEETAKRRTRRTVKHQRGIVGADMSVINALRNMSDKERQNARQNAIAKAKEDKKAKEGKKAAGKVRRVFLRLSSRKDFEKPFPHRFLAPSDRNDSAEGLEAANEGWEEWALNIDHTHTHLPCVLLFLFQLQPCCHRLHLHDYAMRTCICILLFAAWDWFTLSTLRLHPAGNGWAYIA